MSIDTDPTKIAIEFDPLKKRMTGHTFHGDTPFDVPYLSKITPDLWQGGCMDGLLLPQEIKHIISLYPWEQYRVEHHLSSILSIRMYDALDQATDQLDDIARWVNSCRKDAPTLVHCQAGLNRSSLVAARALMLSEDVSGEEAIRIIRENRSPACLCNKAFEQHLLSLT